MKDRFTVSAEKVPSRPGCWDINKVSVLDHGEKVGEYTYLYHGFRSTLFAPFEQNGEWYALCSLDYTATSLMKLPECKIIGGEEGAGNGFCPVEYYVPRYYWYEDSYTIRDEPPHNFRVKIYESDPGEDEPGAEYGQYEPFAFLCGCHWGDDTSWKIQYIDLSRASKGIIKRDDRFGYIELPSKLNLKDAIRIHGDDGEIYGFHIAQERYYKADGTEGG